MGCRGCNRPFGSGHDDWCAVRDDGPAATSRSGPLVPTLGLPQPSRPKSAPPAPPPAPLPPLPPPDKDDDEEEEPVVVLAKRTMPDKTCHVCLNDYKGQHNSKYCPTCAALRKRNWKPPTKADEEALASPGDDGPRVATPLNVRCSDTLPEMMAALAELEPTEPVLIQPPVIELHEPLIIHPPAHRVSVPDAAPPKRTKPVKDLPPPKRRNALDPALLRAADTGVKVLCEGPCGRTLPMVPEFFQAVAGRKFRKICRTCYRQADKGETPAKGVARMACRSCTAPLPMTLEYFPQSITTGLENLCWICIDFNHLADVIRERGGVPPGLRKPPTDALLTEKDTNP